MKLLIVVTAIILIPSVVASRPSDSTRLWIQYAHHCWTRTSYDNASFKTNDFHLFFRPSSSCLVIEVDGYYNLEGRSEMQRMLESYTGSEQPFPFGLQSLQSKLHLIECLALKDWLRLNRIVVGNFHRNTQRYEYLDFSRYVLHSPLDIENRRSLADWGIYGDLTIWKLSLESFLLHSLDSDHTTGFQARLALPISQALSITPIVNGLADHRTDADYNLSYSLGKDRTFSGSALIRLQVDESDLTVKPLIAHNEHKFIEATSSRSGYLRNCEATWKTPEFSRLPDSWAINQVGFQLDGIIESNDLGYHPNFAYDSDELNDDSYRQTRLSEKFTLWNTPDSSRSEELPAFLYDRENINVRLGEAGAEVGLKLEGYRRAGNGILKNVLNLGLKYARYSQTGETHASKFDDSWLSELEVRSFDGHLEFNFAFWQRKTNIARDPALKELKVSTWIGGVSYVLSTGALFGRQDRTKMKNTRFSMFFRRDDFTEIYDQSQAQDSGSIFMATLQTSLFQVHRLGLDLNLLYRKYVPDDHIVARVFPPNNTIRISLSLNFTI